MATTVVSAFDQFRSNLEITDLQTETVSTRHNGVRDVLKSGLTLVGDFLTGSYARQTMIGPLKEADVDVFALLDVKYFHQFNGQNGGPAALLELVRRTLRVTYTKTPDVSRNGQAVTIRFTDFLVDVVPGFHRTGGGFLIPNSVTQSWLSTDPKRHVELFSAANRTHQQKLIPLIKMIKGWNKCHSSFFTSFHLEVLALQILANVTITDFPSGLRFFFDKAREAIEQKNPDPAGYGDDVGKYINTPDKVAEAKRRMTAAYEAALRAEQHGVLYSRTAIDLWHGLIPRYFPVYG
jgi:hypothetical protein